MEFNNLFKINEPKTIDKAFYCIKIVGDCNDGDYAHSEDVVDVDLFENKVVLAISLLMNNGLMPHGIEKLYLLDNKISDFIYDNVGIPGDSYGSCHTIDSIDIKKYNVDGTISIVDIHENYITEEEEIALIDSIKED